VRPAKLLKSALAYSFEISACDRWPVPYILAHEPLSRQRRRVPSYLGEEALKRDYRASDATVCLPTYSNSCSTGVVLCKPFPDSTIAPLQCQVRPKHLGDRAKMRR
jgi:hypothetical protein